MKHSKYFILLVVIPMLTLSLISASLFAPQENSVNAKSYNSNDLASNEQVIRAFCAVSFFLKKNEKK